MIIDRLISRISNISIRNKLFILIAIIITASLSILAYISNGISTKAIIDKAKNNSSRELFLINRNLATMVADIENYSRIVAVDNRLQAKLEQYDNSKSNSIENLEIGSTVSEVISNIVTPNTYVAAASVMTPDHYLFDEGYADIKTVYSIFNSDFVDYILKKQTPVWTSLFKLKYKFGREENAFAVAKAVINKDSGRTEGLVMLYIREKDISSIYQENKSNNGYDYLIVDQNGIVISAGNKDNLYKKFDSLISSYPNDKVNLKTNESHVIILNNRKVLLTSQTFNKLNWKIISSVPLDAITVENKKINTVTLLVGALCLAFAFIASFVLSHSISRPIYKLVNTMRSIRHGDFEMRADFNAGGEIGLLAEGFNRLMDRIKGLMNDIYEEQKARRGYEFKLLQSQIKPHFLYNTIETINMFIRLDMKDNALKTTDSLANFYRISLSKGNDIITIGEEIRLIESYLSIQKFRYVEYMDYEIQVEEEILKFNIPKLTLQPLVENAIYHGLKQRKDKGLLSISGYREGDYVLIEVYDNGVGMEAEKINEILKPSGKNDNSANFGASSVDSRLKLLYGSNSGLKIESEIGSYTKVIVQLQISR